MEGKGSVCVYISVLHRGNLVGALTLLAYIVEEILSTENKWKTSGCYAHFRQNTIMWIKSQTKREIYLALRLSDLVEGMPQSWGSQTKDSFGLFHYVFIAF